MDGAAIDYRLYMDATERWLRGGPFYEPYQLAGPYTISAGDILYPPVALWLFVPLSFLPACMWWLVPLGATGDGRVVVAARLPSPGPSSPSVSSGRRRWSS